MPNFFYSDYGTVSPVSPMNDTLSPVEKILYSNLISGGRRSTSPADSDTSGISSEGSEAALIDMMVRKLHFYNTIGKI